MRAATRLASTASPTALAAAGLGLVVASLVAGCTKVSTGANDDPRLVQGGADEDGDDSGDGTDATGSCFGVVDAAKAPAAMQEFCADTPATIKSGFVKAFKTMCDEHKLVGLAQPSCAWDGAKDKQSAYIRVLEKTDPSDAAQEFTFFAAYAMAIKAAPEDFLDVIVKTYTDPDFASTYVPIKNAHVEGGKGDAKSGLDYTVELATSAAAVKFRGRSDIQRYKSGMIGVFDRAVGDKVLIVDNNALLLLIPAKDGGSLYVAVDDKKVEDSGNHRLAASSALALDKERMGNAFENATRKAGK
jgi:hypothetical protein